MPIEDSEESEGTEQLQWARRDEHLLEIIDRRGARARDILLRTDRRDEVPYRETLEEGYRRGPRSDKYPIVWIDFTDDDGDRIPLCATLSRFFAQATPVKNILKFMDQWEVVRHIEGRRIMMGQRWEKVEHTARRKDKRWGVYGVRPTHTDGDAVVVARSNWFVADPDYVDKRETRLLKEDGDWTGSL